MGETDDLLDEVLGNRSKTRKKGQIVRIPTGPKRSSSRVGTLQIQTETAPPVKKPDLIDSLLAKNELEELYSAKLAQAVDDITSGGSTSGAPKSRPRFAPLESIETNEFSHETTYLVVYFAPTTAVPKVASFTPSVPFTAPDPSSADNTPSLTKNTEKNQEIFNRFCSAPGAILKLPLLKALLRRLPCPPHIADWLLHIMLYSKVHHIALEAYDILLNMLPQPSHGWRARISKNNSSSSNPSASHGLPFFWNYQKVAEVFNKFGAGQLASVVTGNGEQTLLKNTFASLPRLLTGQFDIQNLMGQLERQAVEMTDEAQAATIALAARQLEESLKCDEFNADNFALVALHLAAACESGYVKMSREELVTMLVAVYRASVDPSCQTIIVDIQALMLSIYELLFSLVAPSAIPRLVHDICEALWAQIPEAQKADFHATYFRWVYLTPCSTKPMRSARSAMAMLFLKALANKPTLPIIAPSAEVASYMLGDPLVTLSDVSEFLVKAKIEKSPENNWPRFANWILLIDVATACFDAADLPNLKRPISQWETSFSNFHAPARERGTFNLSLARFKDLATHSLTKIRVINNSNSALQDTPRDAFASWRENAAKEATASS